MTTKYGRQTSTPWVRKSQKGILCIAGIGVGYVGSKPSMAPGAKSNFANICRSIGFRLRIRIVSSKLGDLRYFQPHPTSLWRDRNFLCVCDLPRSQGHTSPVRSPAGASFVGACEDPCSRRISLPGARVFRILISREVQGRLPVSGSLLRLAGGLAPVEK